MGGLKEFDDDASIAVLVWPGRLIGDRRTYIPPTLSGQSHVYKKQCKARTLRPSRTTQYPFLHGRTYAIDRRFLPQRQRQWRRPALTSERLGSRIATRLRGS